MRGTLWLPLSEGPHRAVPVTSSVARVDPSRELATGLGVDVRYASVRYSATEHLRKNLVSSSPVLSAYRSLTYL